MHGHQIYTDYKTKSTFTQGSNVRSSTVARIFISIRSVTISALLLAFIVGCEASSIPLKQSKHTAIATYDADISDDGRFSVVASVNHDAGFWDLDKNALLYNWSHSDQSDVGIIAVDISPDGTRVATATDNNIAIWDTSNGKNLGFYSLPESDLRDLAISDRGEYLVLGLGDSRVVHINLKTGRRLEFLGHTEAINSLDISPNGRYVLSAGNDYKAIFWDSKTGQALQQWKHNSRVILVALSRDGQLAFTAGNKANAFIWDLRTGDKVSKLDLAQRQYVLSAARFSPDNLTLLTGAPSRQLILWNVESGKLEKQILVSQRKKNRPTGAIIYAVGFSKNGELLTESSAGFGEVWSATDDSDKKKNE